MWPSAAPKTRPAYASLRRGKHKGGPVAGTPSPIRTRLSPELQAYARRLYETTDQFVTDIALDCGVDESVVRRMAERESWVRYAPPPRDLPPVAKLLAEVEALEASLAEAPADRCAVPTDGGTQDNIARFIAVVMAHLDEFEALRKNGKLLPKQHLATARAISILTEAYNRLQRMRAAEPGSIHHDSYADAPADLDAFRDELARRIRAFVASRTGARHVDGNSGPVAVDGVR